MNLPSWCSGNFSLDQGESKIGCTLLVECSDKVSYRPQHVEVLLAEVRCDLLAGHHGLAVVELDAWQRRLLGQNFWKVSGFVVAMLGS